MKRVFRPIFHILLLINVLGAPASRADVEKPPDFSSARLLDRVGSGELTDALRRDWAESAPETGPSPDWIQASRVRAIYTERAFAPLFLNSQEGLGSAARLVESLASSERHGLDPARYRTSIILQAVEGIPPPPDRGFLSHFKRSSEDRDAIAARLARLDGLLLDRYLTLAIDLAGDSGTSGEHGALADSILAGAVHASLPDVDSWAPDHPQYRALEECLATYRRVVDQGGWPSIREGETIHPEDRDRRVTQIRARLDAEEKILTGAAPSVPAEPDRLDPDLVERLKRFQSRHALDEDGAAGKMTVAALNVTAPQRLRQIEITMARWRQGPRDNPPYRVEANIPGMLVFLYRDGAPVLTLRTVVGSGKKTAMWKGKQEKAETPELEDQIETIEVNPRWYVPEKIVYTELQKSETKKPGFLDKGGYEWYDPKTGGHGPASELPDSAWANASSNLKIRQRPGVQNALGKLKILFHNRFAVYMHDTPEKKLFARGRRNYSHGCVRVQNVPELAESLLAHSEIKPKAPLKRLLADTARVTITLKPFIPIRLVYRTVWVQEDGRVDFLPDIYELDDAVGKTVPLSAELQNALKPRESKADEDEESADPVSP